MYAPMSLKRISQTKLLSYHNLKNSFRQVHLTVHMLFKLLTFNTSTITIPSERIERQRRRNHPEGMAAGDRPAGRRKEDGHACHEIHAGGFESSGTAPQNRHTGFPIRRQTVYLPNKSLCVPVRASVSTRTSSSMR